MPGPEARAVSCPLCNEKFFPSSLPFHQKQCERRRATRVVNCPYCSIEVVQLDLPKHIEKCPKGVRKPGTGHGSGPGGHGAGHGSHEARGSAAAGQFDPEVLSDGRMRCVYCGRCFNPERIEKHQSICGHLKNARPKGLDGKPTQTGAKVFDAAAQRTGVGAAFVSPEEYQRRQDRRLRDSTPPKKSDWRQAHEEFVAACKAGRGEAVAPARPKHGVPCPHCGRSFDATAAERHIPICANVRNRPRPPPSESQGRCGGQVHNSLPTPPTGHRGHLSPPPPRTPASERGSSSPSPRQSPNTYGAGFKAARQIRRYSSHEKLPGLEHPPAGRRASNSPSSPSPSSTPGRRPPVDPHGPGKSREAPAAPRLGLRRSAMLYRLLTQVSADALRHELAECGVAAEHLDGESLIEAVIEQLM